MINKPLLPQRFCVGNASYISRKSTFIIQAEIPLTNSA